MNLNPFKKEEPKTEQERLEETQKKIDEANEVQHIPTMSEVGHGGRVISNAARAGKLQNTGGDQAPDPDKFKKDEE